MTPYEIGMKLAASRFSVWMRAAPLEKLRPAVNELLGSASPSYLKHSIGRDQLKALRDGASNVDREGLLKFIRTRIKLPFDNNAISNGDFAPRTLAEANAKLRRSKFRDIAFAKSVPERAKSTPVRIAHEGSLDELQQMLKRGPNTGLDNPAIGVTGAPEVGGAYFHRVGGPADVQRTGFYADRATGVRGGKPARLEFDFPRELIPPSKNHTYEPVVPKSLWKYLSNPTLTTL